MTVVPVFRSKSGLTDIGAFCRWLACDIPICVDHNGCNREDWNNQDLMGMPPFANANQGVFVDEIDKVACRRGERCVI